MRSLKKGLALVCMLAMVLQLIFAAPVVSAAEPNSYDVVFLSDLHNGVGGYNGLKQMMTELKNEGQNPRVLSHGGDYVEDDMGGQPDWQTQVYDVISGTERAAFPEAKQGYTLGNHDWEAGTFGGTLPAPVFCVTLLKNGPGTPEVSAIVHRQFLTFPVESSMI